MFVIGFHKQMTFVREPYYTTPWDIVLETNRTVLNKIMTENRKRSREDDTCDFMPLSKRINNLHINNNINNALPSQTSPESSQLGQVKNNGISSPSSSSESDRRPSYDPGLNSNQSNYYYDNKLLFELHLERIQRSGQQFPF